VIESIKNLFVRETIDTRIEQALPVLAKIQKQGQAMKEINMFEAWANRLTEGTWTTPETPEQKQQLVDLLSKDLPVGADALNATEQLYDLLGDDQLFDQLEKLADQDANADARQTILDRMIELGQNPDIAEVITQLNIDTDPADELEVDTSVEVDELTEESDDSGVESAILRRIMNSHLELLKQYGPAAVMAAARDVAEMIGDVEEIGSSDVSAYVKRVVQSLADGSYADLAEQVNEEQLNEFLPALGAVLGRAVAGAGAGALERGAAGVAGHAIGSGIEDMLSNDEEVDEGIGGSWFVVYDDGREPYGPISQDQAQSISQRTPGTEVVAGTQLAAYQQSNRRNANAVDEGRCNMTAEGEECPMHGLKECNYMENLDTDGVMSTKASNMSSESADPMLSRLKTLSGIIAR
jgi:hypothetical protein